MSHARDQVIDAMVALLSVTPANWDLVKKQRIESTRIIKTYLMVYFESEEVERLTIHTATLYRRVIGVNVEAPIRIADPEDLETTIGAVAAEIEQKLTNAAMLAQLPAMKDFSLVHSTVLLDEDQTSYAKLSITWAVTVMTAEGSPSTLI